MIESDALASNPGPVSDDKTLSLRVSGILEEYKSLTHREDALQMEVHRWSTLYVAAVVVAIGWLVNNGTADHFLSLQKGDPTYLLVIAGVNAIYIFSMAFKGYEYQQLDLYISIELAARFKALTGEDIFRFTEWRKTKSHGTKRGRSSEPLRAVYYLCVSIMPIGASAAILGSFAYYRLSNYSRFDSNIFLFWLTLLFNIFCLCASVWTSRTEMAWKKIVKNRSIDVNFKRFDDTISRL